MQTAKCVLIKKKYICDYLFVNFYHQCKNPICWEKQPPLIHILVKICLWLVFCTPLTGLSKFGTNLLNYLILPWTLFYDRSYLKHQSHLCPIE